MLDICRITPTYWIHQNSWKVHEKIINLSFGVPFENYNFTIDPLQGNCHQGDLVSPAGMLNLRKTTPAHEGERARETRAWKQCHRDLVLLCTLPTSPTWWLGSASSVVLGGLWANFLDRQVVFSSFSLMLFGTIPSDLPYMVIRLCE